MDNITDENIDYFYKEKNVHDDVIFKPNDSCDMIALYQSMILYILIIFVEELWLKNVEQDYFQLTHEDSKQN